VKEHVVHVHIKDCTNPPSGETEPENYTLPGDGQQCYDSYVEYGKATNALLTEIGWEAEA